MEITMATSSSTVSALSGVGLGSPAPAAGGFEPHRSEFRRLQAELSEFVRDVHASRYRALSPMLAALLFGLALTLVAALSPAPRTLQSMLSGDDLAALGDRDALPASYELPPQWQWPALAMPPAPVLRLACDPALSDSAC
jgi:hypothetical protein